MHLVCETSLWSSKSAKRNAWRFYDPWCLLCAATQRQWQSSECIYIRIYTDGKMYKANVSFESRRHIICATTAWRHLCIQYNICIELNENQYGTLMMILFIYYREIYDFDVKVFQINSILYNVQWNIERIHTHHVPSIIDALLRDYTSPY